MTVTKTFKDSRDANQGCGYFGYIENDLLVLGQETLYGCVVNFRGDYHAANACAPMVELKKHDRVLYDDINNYFKQKLELENAKKKYSFDEATKTILFKVKLHMDNLKTHEVLVRGRSQSGVVDKLMPKIPEVLMLQTLDAREFAVRSNKIDAVEFVED